MVAYNFIVLKKLFGSRRLPFSEEKTLKIRRDKPDFTIDLRAHVESKRSSKPTCSFSNEYVYPYMDCMNDTTCEYLYFLFRKSLCLFKSILYEMKVGSTIAVKTYL